MITNFGNTCGLGGRSIGFAVGLVAINLVHSTLLPISYTTTLIAVSYSARQHARDTGILSIIISFFRIHSQPTPSTATVLGRQGLPQSSTPPLPHNFRPRDSAEASMCIGPQREQVQGARAYHSRCVTHPVSYWKVCLLIPVIFPRGVRRCRRLSDVQVSCLDMASHSASLLSLDGPGLAACSI